MSKPKRLTKAQRLQDEQVLAAIIAAGPCLGRVVKPANTHDGVTGHGNGFGHRTNGACCAVGAGVLYRGIASKDLFNRHACSAFAELYGVSCAYAEGVSAGFESSLVSDPHSLGYGSYAEGDDAARGLAVGRAAFVALCLSEEGASS